MTIFLFTAGEDIRFFIVFYNDSFTLQLGRISDFSLYWNSRISTSDLVGDTGLVQSGVWKVSADSANRYSVSLCTHV